MMISQMLKVCTHNQYDTARTLTIAKKSEVSIEQYNCIVFLIKGNKIMIFHDPFRCS